MQKSSISELIDQLEAWDTQDPVTGNRTDETILLALEALDARVAHLQRISEGMQSTRNGLWRGVESPAPLAAPGESAPASRDFTEEFSAFAANLINRINRMHFDIERRLELQQADLAKRMEELEGSIRRRDLTFIESLVTVAELSWVRPEQDLLGSSLRASSPPD